MENKEPDPFSVSCEICHLVLKKKNIAAHMFLLHGEEKKTAVRENLFKCDKCEKSYGSDRALRRHGTTVHNSSNEGTVECPIEDCSRRFVDYLNMSSHVGTEHPDSVIGSNTYIDETFGTMQEFETWKQRIRDLGTDFRIDSSRLLKDGGKVTYYRCRNSGPSRARGQIKRYGHLLRRIVDCCTAHCTVTACDTSINVKGALFHCNHFPEPARLPLSQSDKDFVENLIKEGSLPEKIVRRCREQFRETERLHYLTMKDIKSLSFNFAPGRKHREDINSFVIRAEEGNVEDGILHYNVSTEDSTETVVVICTPTQQEALKKHGNRGFVIDDTFNATKYVLKLTTLIVVDQAGRGIPAAYMLSHKLRTEESTVFFEILRKVHPDMKPEFLMSDDTTVFWNGFLSVFPELSLSTRKLLCRWHILQAWIRKAKSRKEDGSLFIANDADFKVLKKNLRSLVRVPSEEKFHDLFLHIVDWLESTGNGDYAQYLARNYAHRAQEWKSQSGVPFCTSMHSEAWHSHLKSLLLQKKKNVRLDTLVEVLISAPGKIVERQRIEDIRGYTNNRQSSNHKRHRAAVAFYGMGRGITEALDDGTWKVSSKSNEQTFYVVAVFQDCRCKNSRCHPCMSGGHPCPCQFSCTCLDQSAGVSCAHVHGLCLQMTEEPAVDQLESDESEYRLPPPVHTTVTSGIVHVSPVSDGAPIEDSPHEDVPLVSESDRKKELLANIEKEYSNIHAAALRLHKSEASESVEMLFNISEKMTEVANICKMSGWQIRPDAKGKKMETIRPFKIDKRKRARLISDGESEGILPSVASFCCSHCKQSDAPQHGHEEQMDEWKQCPCERWYHSTCTLLFDTCICGTVVNLL